MIKEIIIDHNKVKVSDRLEEFFIPDTVEAKNAFITRGIMEDGLDTIYDLVHSHYPKAFRPRLLFGNCNECNALAVYASREIIVYTGLIQEAARLIELRYTDKVLQKHNVLNGLSTRTVQSGIRVYLWRYVILHELYHLWHGHGAWKAKYRFDENGNLGSVPLLINAEVDSEKARRNESRTKKMLSRQQIQDNLTAQALEHDADSCAVSMLINLLLRNADAKQLTGEERKKYVSQEITLIMGALTTAFCLFDGNAGAKFDELNDLCSTSHPLPAIRMVHAEEIADGVLYRFYPDFEERMKMEDDWRKIVCDVEADYDGTVDMGRVFYYTAHTEKAQKHLSEIKRRITEIQDTLESFSVSNNADKLDPEDIEYLPESVWFDDAGNSLRGWVNPATGKPCATKAKQKPIVKKKVPGRNDKCPCGSGKKFKNCCIEKRIYD